MAHGVNAMLKKLESNKTGVGSRRIFPPHFKLQVLDSYRNDVDCKGNQRATARKYGIHRRQIQKWLQVEGNLRNSVSTNNVNVNINKGKEEIKKCDVALKCETETTTTTVFPLDFTTRNDRVHGSPSVANPNPSSFPASPIDLSLKRPTPCTPVCFPLSPPHSSPPPHLSPSRVHINIANVPEPNVWDLSTKRKSSNHDEDDLRQTKPIKLFKPYLLDDLNLNQHDENENSRDTPSTNSYDYYTNNNNNNNNNTITTNNNIYETYTIQELHPKNNSIIYYYHPYPLYPSPEPFVTSSYDNNENKRQSYSLDFKLSAIDSYYRDDLCRGNQRAVASKYNVHRRQVQKWLQQEDELRQRNDKHHHIHVAS
ncbi:rho GTPase-activating protein gacK [Onthophagus taurus]|uniref:rho GTPase-activating protein gacK n=1 Tax=Onthophagus taurus TaxID=166361 RepID=UPI0039BE7F61